MSGRAHSARGYRLRAAPRRGRSGGARTRIRWDRLGRVTLLVVFAAVLLSYIKPAVNFVDAWRDSHAQEANLAELREENRQLRQRIATLSEPATAERAARRLGMFAPGETPYVIKRLGKR